MNFFFECTEDAVAGYILKLVHPSNFTQKFFETETLYLLNCKRKWIKTFEYNNVHNTKQNKKCSALILLRFWTLPLFLDYFKYLCHCNIISITAEHTKVMLGTNFTSYGLITYGGTWFKLP